MSENDKLINFVSKRILGVDGNITSHGNSIINAYKRVSYLPKIKFQYCKQRPLLIDGAKIYNSLDCQLLSQSHLLMRVRDPLKLTKWPGSWSISLNGYGRVVKALTYVEEKPLLLQLKEFRQLLNKIQPNVCIVNSTIDPISRLLVLAAKQMNIKTAAVQHGTYAESTPINMLDEDIVDIFFVLDKQQKKIMSRAFDQKKMICIGTESSSVYNGISEGNICLVGTDLERYGEAEKKNKLLNQYFEISQFLKRNGKFKIYYKPHPSETVSIKTRSNFTLVKNNDLSKMDVFLGFNSTLLKDMNTAGKMSIQMYDPFFSAVNYEVFGYCKSFHIDETLNTKVLNYIKFGGPCPKIINLNLPDLFRKHLLN